MLKLRSKNVQAIYKEFQASIASKSLNLERCNRLPMMIAIGAIVMTATSMNTPIPVSIIADIANAR